jgi:hypothetical protein
LNSNKATPHSNPMTMRKFKGYKAL